MTTKQLIRWGAIIGIIFFIVAMIIRGDLASAFDTKVEFQAPVVEVEKKDSIDKLTENLEHAMRLSSSTAAHLSFMEEEYLKAKELHDSAVDQENAALDAINTFNQFK